MTDQRITLQELLDEGFVFSKGYYTKAGVDSDYAVYFSPKLNAGFVEQYLPGFDDYEQVEISGVKSMQDLKTLCRLIGFNLD